MSKEKAPIRFHLVNTTGRVLSKPFHHLGYLARVSWVSYLLFAALLGALMTGMFMIIFPVIEELGKKATEQEYLMAVFEVIARYESEIVFGVYASTIVLSLIMIPPTIAWVRFQLSGVKTRGLGVFHFGAEEWRAAGFLVIYTGLFLCFSLVLDWVGRALGVLPGIDDILKLDIENTFALEAEYPYSSLASYVFILVGYWFYARWSAAFSFIVEDPKASLGMRYSWALTKGVSLKVFGLQIAVNIAFFVGMVTFMSVGTLGGALAFGLVSWVWSTVGETNLWVSGGIGAFVFFVINVIGYGYIIGVFGSASVEVYRVLHGGQDDQANV